MSEELRTNVENEETATSECLDDKFRIPTFLQPFVPKRQSLELRYNRAKAGGVAANVRREIVTEEHIIKEQA